MTKEVVNILEGVILANVIFLWGTIVHDYWQLIPLNVGILWGICRSYRRSK